MCSYVCRMLKYVHGKYAHYWGNTKNNPILLYTNSISAPVRDALCGQPLNYPQCTMNATRKTTGQHILLSIYYWVLSTLSGHLVGGPAHHEGGDHHQHELHHLPLGPGLDSKELITIH